MFNLSNKKGIDFDEKNSKDVEMFDLDEKNWKKYPDLNYSRENAACCVVNDTYIYCSDPLFYDNKDSFVNNSPLHYLILLLAQFFEKFCPHFCAAIF